MNLHKLSLVLALVAGGFLTSTAEYFFKYNLIDLIKDKILALLGRAKADVVGLEAKIKSKL